MVTDRNRNQKWVFPFLFSLFLVITCIVVAAAGQQVCFSRDTREVYKQQ
jgi:hypothetical protein